MQLLNLLSNTDINKLLQLALLEVPCASFIFIIYIPYTHFIKFKRASNVYEMKKNVDQCKLITTNELMLFFYYITADK